MNCHTDWFAANAAHISANAVRREPIRVTNKNNNFHTDWFGPNGPHEENDSANAVRREPIRVTNKNKGA